MMLFKKSVILLSLLSLTSCSLFNIESNDKEIVVSKVEIVGDDSVGYGEYTTFKLTNGEGEEIASSSVTWTSSDKSVATVSSTGVIKAIKYGKTTITAKYKDFEDSKEIEVVESVDPAVVMKKFLISTPSYHLDVKGGYSIYNLDFSVDMYTDSHEIHQGDTTTGWADHNELVIQYDVSNSRVTSASYLRRQYTSHYDTLYSLQNLSGYTFNTTKRDDNTYEFSGYTQLYTYMIYEAIQHNDTLVELSSSVVEALEKAVLVVKTSKSIEVTFTFSNEQTIVMNYSLLTKENELLHNYLEGHEPTYPEIIPMMNTIKNLAKNHNYYRDFEYYKKDDGTKIPRGKCYFTEDYIFYHYSEEYKELMRGTEFAVEDHGAINRKNGVYEFTYTKDENGEYKVTLSKNQLMDSGKVYMKYYEIYENLTIIMDYVDDELYTFDTSVGFTKSYGGETCVSIANSSANMCNAIMTDYIEALSLTPIGLGFEMKEDKENEANTIVSIGGLFTYGSSFYYQAASYPYSGFNSVEGFDFLDELANK